VDCAVVLVLWLTPPVCLMIPLPRRAGKVTRWRRRAMATGDVSCPDVYSD
jgi:hypothetical protein